MNPIVSLRTVLPAAALLSLMACAGESPLVAPNPMVDPKGADPVSPRSMALATCRVSLAAGTVSCNADTTAGSGTANILLGGQGTHVTLSSNTVSYAAGVFQFNARVTNRLSMPLGSADGSTPHADGIRMVLLGAPTVTSGTGSITAANATGTATYSAPNQSYWRFDGNLASGATSGDVTVQFNVPATVTTFSFRVAVAATVPQESGILRWTAMTPPSGVTAQMTSVACTATYCVASGAGLKTIRWNGNIANSWTDQSTLDTWRSAQGASCIVDTCYISGFDGTILRSTDAGLTWTEDYRQGSTPIYGVSCLSSTQCVAVRDGARAVQRATDGTWSEFGANAENLYAVSCTTSPSEACTAVGAGGDSFPWPSWSKQNTGTSANLQGVSCPNANFCVAVGFGFTEEFSIDGQILYRVNSTWSAGPVVTGTIMNGVSCVSTQMCVAVGNSGTIRVWDGSNWVSHSSGTGGDLLAVSCWSSTQCVAVGRTADYSSLVLLRGSR
jgi:hypothetical protein